MILVRDFQGPVFNTGFSFIGGDQELISFIPHLLSTSVDQITLFRGRENEAKITIKHDGDLIDLSVFSRYQLFGLSESAIDTQSNPGVISGNDSGVLSLNIGSLITFSGIKNTTLVAYNSQYPEGVVLWDNALPRSSVSVQIVDSFTAIDPDSDPLTSGVRIRLQSRTNDAYFSNGTGFTAYVFDYSLVLANLTADKDGYLMLQHAAMVNIGEELKIGIESSDGLLTGFMRATIEDLTTYLP